MHIYDRLHVKKYINAHDTYTVYGGSRMSTETLESMRQAAECFVDMHELQKAIGERIAAVTHNEAAFVTNGAAGALQLAAAVCMTDGDSYRYSCLPKAADGTKDEIIVMRCHRNAYDKALEGAGARIVEIGDADETLEFVLEGAITPRTAAVFFFDNIAYRRAQLPLDRVIAVAHNHGIPVVVDAAAMLPPRENLWRYTEMGADMAIFSGGKTICGPQDSGLLLGSEKYISLCTRFGAPEHGVCRSCKCSREAMVGLLTALEDFLSRDGNAEYSELQQKLQPLDSLFSGFGFRTETVSFGPVGQHYPRLFVYMGAEKKAEDFTTKMRELGIYIGLDKPNSAVYFSPLNLSSNEVQTVCRAADGILSRG